ncbi:MAG: helix-turn-helix transcriptional regulator [Gordonibacter sp.]|uniref:helix-turn-helix domain-containing protein n=3 Tax=Gordonibacter sp. TaxID=1968902 RepID=UPI002FC89BA6
MELNEKLKALRQERGMTQEQVAAKLYVSRTAVSKWETGGGSPNLDSLQALARLFEVSVDELLSGDDLIVLARDEQRSSVRDSGLLAFGLLDLLAALFAFLPLYAVREEAFVRMASLANYGFSVDFGLPFVLMAGAVAATAIIGTLEVAIAIFRVRPAARGVSFVGFAVQVVAVVAFTATMQPYATTLMFSLLVAKAVVGYRMLRS